MAFGVVPDEEGTMARRLLTLAEAAVVPVRSSVTVGRMVRAGRLRAMRIGPGPRAPLFVTQASVEALARVMRRPAGRKP